MGVAVDAAGQHELAARVDLAPPGRQAEADRRDRLAADADIGPEGVGGGRDRAAADDEVVRVRSWTPDRS